jgi:glucans biosynthesis protein
MPASPSRGRIRELLCSHHVASFASASLMAIYGLQPRSATSGSPNAVDSGRLLAARAALCCRNLQLVRCASRVDGCALWRVIAADVALGSQSHRDRTMNKRKRDNPIEDAIWPAHVSQRCGAKARSTGEPCRRWASIGSARCRLHGGAAGSGRPIVHGKYSVEAKRQRKLVRVARYLLRHFHGKPPT